MPEFDIKPMLDAIVGILPPSLLPLLEIIAKILPAVAFAFLFPLVVLWYERKLLARVNLRIGPLHVGRYAGWLQLVADFIKLYGKEMIAPRKADKVLFVSMPTAIALISALPLAMIPFDPNTVIFKFDFSLLFVLAAFVLMPVFILLTGWASNNKYAFIGGLRTALQMLAYEVPLLLSVVGVVVISRSLDLIKIVEAQSAIWFILLQPLGFALFFIAALAEMERLPFDIPSAEQEIVFGWMAEYTGINLGLFMMANYIRFGVLSLLASILFLGGWHGPFLPPALWLLLKTALIVTVIILIRGAYPRVRIDQLLRTGWLVLIPLAILNIFLAVLALPLIPGGQ